MAKKKVKLLYGLNVRKDTISFVVLRRTKDDPKFDERQDVTVRRTDGQKWTGKIKYVSRDRKRIAVAEVKTFAKGTAGKLPRSLIQPPYTEDLVTVTVENEESEPTPTPDPVDDPDDGEGD